MSGTGENTGPNGTPGPFAWAPDLDAPVVDLLKSKGMFDDPVKGANMLARSYHEANKALSGADVILRPGDWTNQEAVDKYLAKVRPATEAEYEVKFGDGVKDPEGLGNFSKKLFHAMGVPKALAPKGAELVQNFITEQAAMTATAAAKANDDAVTALKTKVGAEAFTAGTANAQAVFKSLAAKGQLSKETLAAVEANIGAAPLLELLFAIGSNMTKEAAVLGNGGGAPPTDPTQMTPEQATVAITALQGDKEFQAKYTDAKHPEHAVAVARMLALFEAKARQPAR